MQKYLILLALALIGFACGGGEGDTPSEAPPSNSEVEADSPSVADVDAKKIWKVRCIACHGLYGDMGTNGAANLQEATSDLDYRINIITNGSENGVMTAFGEILEPHEIEAMARYTMEFNENL